MLKGELQMQHSVSRAWFATIKDPEKYGYIASPFAVCKMLQAEWTSGNPARSGVWLFCESPDGHPHVHMFLLNRQVISKRQVMKIVSVDSVFPLQNIEKDLEHILRILENTDTILALVC